MQEILQHLFEDVADFRGGLDGERESPGGLRRGGEIFQEDAAAHGVAQSDGVDGNAGGLRAGDGGGGGEGAGVVFAIGEDDDDFAAGAAGEIAIDADQAIVERSSRADFDAQDGAGGGDLIGGEGL